MSALVVSDVSRNFGGVQALSNISFEVEPGERRLIIGPNGAGKTTLFNMLAGAFPVSDGTVTLFGRDITDLPAYERARLGLSRTFQITNLFPRLERSRKHLAGAAGRRAPARRPCSGACAPTARFIERADALLRNGI